MPHADYPFDVDDTEDKLLKGLVMALMLLVSKRPNMTLEIDRKEFVNFPYECYQLSAFKDEESGNYTFILLRSDDCEVQH